VNYKGPKFSLGDLVMFRQEFMGDLVDGLGIIITEPTLIFRYNWPNSTEFPSEFWSYDIKIGNELFKMIPEQFLRGLKDDVQD